MRAINLMALGLVGAAGPVQAADIQFSLSAHVPARCSIGDVRPLDLATGTVEVRAACNAETFRVQLGGDLASRALRSAIVDNGTPTVFGDAVTVRASRPGQFLFILIYDEDLSGVREASASIDPLQ